MNKYVSPNAQTVELSLTDIILTSAEPCYVEGLGCSPDDGAAGQSLNEVE